MSDGSSSTTSTAMLPLPTASQANVTSNSSMGHMTNASTTTTPYTSEDVSLIDKDNGEDDDDVDNRMVEATTGESETTMTTPDDYEDEEEEWVAHEEDEHSLHHSSSDDEEDFDAENSHINPMNVPPPPAPAAATPTATETVSKSRVTRAVRSVGGDGEPKPAGGGNQSGESDSITSPSSLQNGSLCEDESQPSTTSSSMAVLYEEGGTELMNVDVGGIYERFDTSSTTTTELYLDLTENSTLYASME